MAVSGRGGGEFGSLGQAKIGTQTPCLTQIGMANHNVWIGGVEMNQKPDAPLQAAMNVHFLDIK